jgi:type VI secretion system protein VasG
LAAPPLALLKLGSLGRRLEEAHGLQVVFTDELVAEMVKRCTEGETGARALDHVLRGSLMPVLAKGILERMADGDVGKTLTIGFDDGGWALAFAD